MTLSQAFGVVVGEICDRRKITHRELADRSRLHRNTIGAIIRGDANPTLDNIESICKSIDIAPWKVLRMAAAKIDGNSMPSRLDLGRDPAAITGDRHA